MNLLPFETHRLQVAPLHAAQAVRVLFVLPSLGRGGAETQTIDLLNGLDPQHFSKNMVTFETALDLKDRIAHAQVRFAHFPRARRLDWRPALHIARMIDAQQIDIVYCALQIALLIGWLGIRLAHRRPRLVLALHTTVNRDVKAELADRWLYARLMRACDRIICVCQAQQAHWLTKFPSLRGRTTVIHNGIDPQHFDPEAAAPAGARLRRQLGISQSAFVAVCIAAFRKEKGHAILIDAFARVSASAKAFLLLAGDGVLRAPMQALAAQKGLAGRVRFLGAVKDVRPLLAAADISILPSRAESFSMAMLESLAMRVPLVAANVGGMSEAVRHLQTGLLVDPGSPAGLADALAFMMAHPTERRAMGAAGRRLVMTQFSRAGMLAKSARTLAAVHQEARS
jgi:glycosyltransferase involved in cell wall biosynthesis